MVAHAGKAGRQSTDSTENAIHEKMSRGEATFQFVDNRPEAAVQRKLQEKATSSTKVKQPGVFQKMEGGVAQLANIQVGFDDTKTQSGFAGPTDSLTTTGLANCIAIVAYHTGSPSRGAVMRHYDTRKACPGTERDAKSRGNALAFDSASIRAAANETSAELVKNAPLAKGSIGFQIALGSLWRDLDPDTSMWKSRFNLINAIVAAVGVEPTSADSSASFDVSTSTLS